MNLIGDKIILRAIEIKDNDLLLAMINDPDMEYRLGGWSFPVSAQNQADWASSLKHNTNILRCVIETRDTREAIGAAMLTEIDYKNGNAEIHIKLANMHRGKGYGTDTIQTIVRYAFEELRLHLIYARINAHNEPSKKLFEKCGFKFEGTLRNRFYKRGKYIDVLSYSILKDEKIS